MTFLTHTVYLLHIHPPLAHAKHYVGITRSDRLRERFAEHQAGRGAALTAAAIASDRELHVARLWHNATFTFEARIKKASHLDRLCPICSVDLDVPIETRYQPIVARRSAESLASQSFAPIGWPKPGERRATDTRSKTPA